MTILNISGTNNIKNEGQVNKPEIDSKRKNIKDFHKGKKELYNCNQPTINMVKYETDKLLVDAHSIWNTWKKPFPVATECEWGQRCWEYTREVNAVTFISITWMTTGFSNWQPLPTLPDTDSEEGYSASHREVSWPLWPPSLSAWISCCGSIWQRECLHFTFSPINLHLAQGQNYTLKLSAQDYGQFNFKFVTRVSQVCTVSALLITCLRITSWSEPSPSHRQSFL